MHMMVRKPWARGSSSKLKYSSSFMRSKFHTSEPRVPVDLDAVLVLAAGGARVASKLASAPFESLAMNTARRRRRR